VKQVEFNTIASSFGCVTSHLVGLHKYIVQEAGHPEHLKNIPENNALSGLAGALISAWKLYKQPKSVIMFLVEDVTYNVCDQKFHEFEIRHQCPEAFVIRRTLTEIGERGTLTEDKRLIIDGHEVGVIYMRSGYNPDQYPTELEWDARYRMEISLAIKSPSIHYHLAGTKKVQQELAKEGILEKFLGDKAQMDSVRDIFTGLYSLDKDATGDKNLENALKNPEKYVLKPQREGGGNNVYGDDIKPFLENIRDSDERCAYILMDRISPPIIKNYMVRPGMEPMLADCISELGVFGYVIGTKTEILENNQVGHMLRTKLSHVNEGGVAAGLGALDSVYLVDTDRCC
jgi:glutathione synthetase